MYYAIEILQEKKKELELDTHEDKLAIVANNILIKDIEKAIFTLEYECKFKNMTEKQIDQYFGVNKR